MKIVAYLVMVLALAAGVSACSESSGIKSGINPLNRKDRVNTLKLSMPMGGSTNPDTNPLLRPRGLPAEAPPAR